ncbi:hypothetical protein [Deinococcus sp. UYEF24]
MDPHLIARELEMTLLAKLLENRHVDTNSNQLMPAAAALLLMRSYLGPGLTLADLERAASNSDVLTLKRYNTVYRVDEVATNLGVCLEVHRWNRTAATGAPFQRLLRDHADRPRPPIAAAIFGGQLLTPRPVVFEVTNQGYGPADAVTVQGVVTPDWVQCQLKGNRIELSSAPAGGGAYRGTVSIQTNVNEVRVEVSTESTAFRVPEQDEVWLDELLPVHADLDRERTRQLLAAQLERLGYQQLPGGVFVRSVTASLQQERTSEWWLTEVDLRTGMLPAFGYPAAFTLFSDADGKSNKYRFDLTGKDHLLSGELIDYFETLDVQPGQRLTLSPYQAGYKAALSPAEPWRTLTGHTLWLQGSRVEVEAHPEVIGALVRRCDEGQITINLLLFGEGELHADLLRQHRAGRLTVRWSQEALPYRLIASGGDHPGFCVPPFGPLTAPAHAPLLLWQAAHPVEGRDYREQSRQRGRDGSGDGALLDLELSVQMHQLVKALRIRPQVGEPASLNPGERNLLYSTLPRRAIQAGYLERPVHAAKLLKELKLSPEQVVSGGNGVRLTEGGYLVPPPRSLGALDHQAAYVGRLYGGIIHHSQLRKLVEVYRGVPIEPMSLVVGSLKSMGWGGNGYRRPADAWEPTIHELTPFTAQVLTHLKRDRRATLAWLRQRVAANEEQLERALQKAESALLNTQQPVIVLSVKPVPQPQPIRSVTPAPAPSPSKPFTLEKAKPVFEPLAKCTQALPDPRSTSQSNVMLAVIQLITDEGPMTEGWLVQRYAALSRTTPRQAESAVVQAAQLASLREVVMTATHLDGHIEYWIRSHKPKLRALGERRAQDITLGEWCELFRALGIQQQPCGEIKAYDQAAAAYNLGSRAGAARPLIGHAYRQVTAG